MKVILQKDVKKIGKRNDILEINDGYARNFLIPQKLAVEATENRVKELKRKQMIDGVEQKVQQDLLLKNFKEIQNSPVILTERANAQGHLFQKIKEEEIVVALKKQHGIVLSKEHILLPEPIKALGEYEVKAKVNGIEGTIRLTVQAL